jgi:hypothetical protein
MERSLFAAAEAERKDDWQTLLNALKRIGAGLALKEFVRIVFAGTHGGRSGALVRSYSQLAGGVEGLWCTISGARKTVASAIRAGLVLRRDVPGAGGQTSANAYAINWCGVAEILTGRRAPGFVPDGHVPPSYVPQGPVPEGQGPVPEGQGARREPPWEPGGETPRACAHAQSVLVSQTTSTSDFSTRTGTETARGSARADQFLRPPSAVTAVAGIAAEIDWNSVRAVATESYRVLFPRSPIDPRHREFFLCAAAIACRLRCERLIVDAAKIARDAKPRNPFRYFKGIVAAKLAVLAGAEPSARWSVLEQSLASIQIPEGLLHPGNPNP